MYPQLYLLSTTLHAPGSLSALHAAAPQMQGQEAATRGGAGSPEPLAAIVARAVGGTVTGQEPSGCTLTPHRLHVAHELLAGQPYFKFLVEKNPNSFLFGGRDSFKLG